MFGFGNKDTAEAKLRVNYDGGKAERGLKNLKAIAATVITAAAIKQLASYTSKLAIMGAQADVVVKNFKNMAAQQGRSVDEMMGKLRNATMGMVSDMELQQQAMKAMIAGVSFDDMITSMEFVTKFAAATGVDAAEKINTVMTGLARKSAAFLDDVGIQVMGSADVVGDAVAQMKEKMDQFATSEEDAFVQTNKLSAELQNMQASIGQQLQPALIKLLPIISDVAHGFSVVLKKLLGIKEVSTELIMQTNKRMKEQAKEVQELKRIIEGEYIPALETLNMGEIEIIGEDEYQGALNTVKRIEKLLGGMGHDLVGSAESRMLQAYQILDEKAAEMVKTFKKSKKELDNLSGNTSGVSSSRGVSSSPSDVPKPPPAGKKGKSEEELLQERMDAAWKQYNALKEVWQAEADAQFEAEQQRLEVQERFEQLRQANREKENQEIIRANNERIAAQREAEQQLQSDIMSIRGSLFTGIMALSEAQTSRELANARITSKTKEELQKKEREIMNDAAQRRAEMAIFQQSVAVAETIASTATAIAAATAGGASAGGPLAAITAIASGLSVAASLAGLVATIEAASVPPPPTFALGRIGQRKRGRGADNIAALIQEGESIIPPVQSAMHEDEIRAIVNNTANTASGIRRINGGAVTMNYYGVTTEGVLQSQEEIRRRGLVGRRI